MNTNCIHIGKPFIEKFKDKVRLCSEIIDSKSKRILYFEVDEEFEKYLVTDRCDCFMLALLNNAMNVGKDIICELGISEELYFQLNTYFIPIVAKQMPDLTAIKIIAKPLNGLVSAYNAVGTGNSGGVDSFYTLVKYKNPEFGNYKLTHILFNNISTADRDEQRIRTLFERDKIEKAQIANELGLKQIALFSNIYSFYKSQFIFNYYFTSQYASAPYALGKLFSKYYYSSGVSVTDFSMDHNTIKDAAYYDIFTLECLSTKALKFYSAGSEVGRLEKTEFIATNPTVQKHLQVCAIEQSSGFYENNDKLLEKLNCGKCGKCLRTISTLYGLGCLDKFENVFDLTFFKYHRKRFIANELATDGHTFLEEIIPLLKSKNLLPTTSIIFAKFLKPYRKLRSKLAQIKWLKRIYRKFFKRK